MQKEDLDALVQWSLKVREMYLDIESRRADARDASVDAVNRLEQTWQLFKDLEAKQIVNDEMLFRELKDRFGSPYGFGVTSAAAWARRRSATCCGSRPRRRGDSLRETIRRRRARSRAARSSGSRS